MDNNEIKKFMEYYGPFSLADACLLWLMRKHSLYFRPFSHDVVRYILLEFCKRELTNEEIIKRVDFPGQKQLVDKLRLQYGITDRHDYEGLELNDYNDVPRVIQEYKNRTIYSPLENKWSQNLNEYWKKFYKETLPLVIEAKGKVFQEQFHSETIVKTIGDDLNRLTTQQAKEEYIEKIFQDYSRSLLNHILTPVDPIEMQEHINGLIGENRGLDALVLLNESHRVHHLLSRYRNIADYERKIGREQQVSNRLLCMMTTTQPTSVTHTPSDMIMSQLGALTNPLDKIAEALNAFLALYNINFADLNEKLGISIDVKIIVNSPNTVSSQIVHEEPDQIITPDGINLPEILNTEKARAAFLKAYKKGWIVSTSDGGITWKGFEPRPSKSQLAYLCGKIYGYKHSASGNEGDNIPYKQLEDLFHVKKMAYSLHQVFASGKTQLWRRLIDEMCEEYR